MKAFNFLLSIIVGFFVAVHCKDCKKAEIELDKNLKKLFWIGESAQIPRTEKDIDHFCGETQLILKEAQAFRSCLGPFSKVIINVIIRQVRKSGKKICQDSKRKQETLRRLQCINDGNIHSLYFCPHRAFIQLNHISSKNYTDPQHVIASFCCMFQRTTQCAKEQVKVIRKDCGRTSNNQHASSLSQLLGGLSGEATDLLCARFSSIEVCERDFAEGVRKLERIADRNQIPFKDIPIIRPLLQLAETLGAKE